MRSEMFGSVPSFELGIMTSIYKRNRKYQALHLYKYYCIYKLNAYKSLTYTFLVLDSKTVERCGSNMWDETHFESMQNKLKL